MIRALHFAFCRRLSVAVLSLGCACVAGCGSEQAYRAKYRCWTFGGAVYDLEGLNGIHPPFGGWDTSRVVFFCDLPMSLFTDLAMAPVTIIRDLVVAAAGGRSGHWPMDEFRNPQFEGWSRFSPGAWRSGVAVTNNVPQEFKEILVQVQKGWVYLERSAEGRTQGVKVFAQIPVPPEKTPPPEFRQERLQVGATLYDTEVISTVRNQTRETLWLRKDVPGGLLKRDSRGLWEGAPVETVSILDWSPRP